MLATVPGTLSVVPKSRLELRTIDEVAEEIERSRATIFRWLGRGWLTTHYVYDPRTGRRKTAVDMDELRRFLERPHPIS